MIWKDAVEYAESCANRGNAYGWDAKWLRYHRAVAQLDAPIYTVALKSLRNDPTRTLTDICRFVDIQFSAEMENIASHVHHIVFGSTTARLSLHKQGSATWHREASHSNRSDIQGIISEKPAAPSKKNLNSIKTLQDKLTPDGLKLPKILPG